MKTYKNLTDLLAALPFKGVVRLKLNADGSVTLFDGEKPLPIGGGAADTDIRAAYEKGIRGACSEPLELLAEKTDGATTLHPFRMNAYTGAAMRIEGFYRPVVVELTGMRVPTKRLPVLRGHDPERIVAHTEDIDLTERRLHVEGVMSGVGASAQETLTLARNRFPWQASIGASVERMEFVDSGGKVKVNGRNFDGPLLVARQSTLREISFVPLGADPGTSAQVGGG